jgi:hypothetical protein
MEKVVSFAIRITQFIE